MYYTENDLVDYEFIKNLNRYCCRADDLPRRVLVELYRLYMKGWDVKDIAVLAYADVDPDILSHVANALDHGGIDEEKAEYIAKGGYSYEQGEYLIKAFTEGLSIADIEEVTDRSMEDEDYCAALMRKLYSVRDEDVKYVNNLLVSSIYTAVNKCSDILGDVDDIKIYVLPFNQRNMIGISSIEDLYYKNGNLVAYDLHTKDCRMSCIIPGHKERFYFDFSDDNGELKEFIFDDGSKKTLEKFFERKIRSTKF